MNENETKRVCLECGEALLGRTDKKFCSDQCRNAYNNRLNSDSNNTVRNINNILRKNRRILAETLANNLKIKISKERLLTEGFNTNYFTNIYKTQKGTIYYFCYEYGYLPLDDGISFLIVTDKNASSN